MKCPERYKVSQFSMSKQITNECEEVNREFKILIENQDYAECYEDECAAWDKENKRCRKVGI